VTRRLYHDDSYLRRFEADVIAHTTHRGQPAIVLDQTAFYPEAGGQLGDRGTIGSATIVDTQELDDGTIVHLVDPGARSESGPLQLGGELPAVGTRVTGELDWLRRRQHMAQHTAQHLLSGTLLDRAQAPTASARLGESTLTIDAARDRIPDAELAAAEDLANDLIDDDVPIRAWFPTADELASMKLRRDPKVSADIRVVSIGDFDFSPCGGTHCARTSQLGAIRITSSERYKGMTRVTFTAGRRARAELFTRDQVLRQLAAQFSCGPAEVPAAIDKLRRDAGASSTEIANLRSRLASLVVDSFAGSGAVIATLPGDAELLRSVAAKLVASGRDAILGAPDDQGTSIVLMRAAGSSLDCGALWRKLAAELGGRGGGRADQAQGRVPCRISNWEDRVRALL
jgi:alanyl-tRNA synthetase